MGHLKGVWHGRRQGEAGPELPEDTGIGTPVPETPDCGLLETEIPSMEGPRDRLRVGPDLNV